MAIRSYCNFEVKHKEKRHENREKKGGVYHRRESRHWIWN